MPNSVIKFVIFGFGHIGKQHASALAFVQNAVLVAVVDAAAVNVPEGVLVFTSLDALIDAKIAYDVAINATPNFAHLPLTNQLIANKKHVLIEKPMGLSALACYETANFAQQNETKLWVVNQLRFTETLRLVKHMVDSNQLGQIKQISIQAFWNRSESYYEKSTWRGTKTSDGGTLFTQFSHFIDALIWLFGMVKIEYVNFANHKHNRLEFEDSGIFCFSFNEDSMGTFHYTTACPYQNFDSSISIIGELGVAKVSGQYMQNLQMHIGSGIESFTNKTQNIPYHSFVQQNIVDVLLNGAAPYAELTDAINTVKLIESVYAFKNNYFV